MFCYVCGAALSVGCILFARAFMKDYKQENHVRAFWLKGGAALCFVLLAVILLLESENRGYACLVLIGLVLGLCGDELLALRFVFANCHDLLFAAGAATFGVGHFSI